MTEPAMTRRGGIGAILGTGDRDFLVRNSGEQVKICDMEANTVALYFSASWCPPCRRFTPKLVETYQEQLNSQSQLQGEKKSQLEVVFVSRDRDEESFDAYFAKMPWLAIPFSDSECVTRLMSRFKVNGIPSLVFLSAGTGEIYTKEGVKLVSEHGAGAAPFTPERIGELKEQEQADRDAQTVHSVLGTPTRDYLIRGDSSSRVPISELQGKHVALLFLMRPMVQFTAVLAEIYEKLREAAGEEKLEVVAVFFRCDESVFEESFAAMPWLAIPHADAVCERLVRYFELRALPTLALLGPDGKTLSSNIADLVEEHGVDAWEAFPFSDEKMQVLISRSRAKAATQTLQSLLVTGDLDYVVGKDGAKVPVSDLVGKTVMLYFAAKWYAPCLSFLPTLVREYGKMKERTSELEIIFVSLDKDQAAFDEHFSGMPPPWLALPPEDERKEPLRKRLRVRSLPALVAVGPSGATLTADAMSHLLAHGAAAFPFTGEALAALERKMDEEAASAWPDKLARDDELHEFHELALTRRDAAAVAYTCDGCQGLGSFWSYRCDRCDFDLHPKCARV